jgi:Tfp pilus assembly protein PilZ
MIETAQEKRREDRYRGRFKIEYASGDQTYRGISSDLSLNGLFIRTRKPLEMGTLITMLLHLPGGLTATLKGKVARVLVTPEGTSAISIRNGMGIEIIEKDYNYLRTVMSFLGGMKSD